MGSLFSYRAVTVHAYCMRDFKVQCIGHNSLQPAAYCLEE